VKLGDFIVKNFMEDVDAQRHAPTLTLAPTDDRGSQFDASAVHLLDSSGASVSISIASY
jgi:hypothetical protein